MTTMWQEEHDWLHPDDVAGRKFPSARGLRRGLDEAEVTAYLGEVSTEMQRLHDAVAYGRREVQRLRDRVLGQDDGKPIVITSDDAHHHAVRILASAQAQADQYVGSAQNYCGRIVSAAEEQRDRILADADRERELAREAAGKAAAAARAAVPPPPLDEAERAENAVHAAFEQALSAGLRCALKATLEGALRVLSDMEARESDPVRLPRRLEPVPVPQLPAPEEDASDDEHA
jgi:cell division septum initiation protein DivIVA